MSNALGFRILIWHICQPVRKWKVLQGKSYSWVLSSIYWITNVVIIENAIYRLLKVKINYAEQTKLKYNPLYYDGESITDGKCIQIRLLK